MAEPRKAVETTVSNDGVTNSTGKSWKEWFTLLKKIKAEDLSHKEIAGKLSEEYDVSGWWAQSITVEFERSIGRREIGQTCDGDFQAGATKMLAGSLDDALKVWQKNVRDRTDFDGVKLENKPSISKTEKWRYWRVSLADGSKVVIVISQKGDNRAQLAVNHEKLPDKAAVDRWKYYWRSFLQNLDLPK